MCCVAMRKFKFKHWIARKGFKGPTDRAVLFFTRTDVVMLLWDGRSQGTKELIDWYRSNQKHHTVGFVGED